VRECACRCELRCGACISMRVCMHACIYMHKFMCYCAAHRSWILCACTCMCVCVRERVWGRTYESDLSHIFTSHISTHHVTCINEDRVGSTPQRGLCRRAASLFCPLFLWYPAPTQVINKLRNERTLICVHMSVRI